MEIIFENRYRQKLNTIRKTTYAKKAVLQASAAHHKKKQLTTPENTITYHNAICCHPKILHKHCFQFLLGPFYLSRENEDNGYAKFWGDKQRALWYVLVFSGVVN